MGMYSESKPLRNIKYIVITYIEGAKIYNIATAQNTLVNESGYLSPETTFF
jgi:hypothetical protein